MNIAAALKRLLRQPWLFTALVGLCGGLAMLALYVLQPVALQRLDLRIYDALLPLRRQSEPSPVPLVVDIDEESLARFGQWPWPRYLVADLVDRLAQNGAASIGLDIMKICRRSAGSLRRLWRQVPQGTTQNQSRSYDVYGRIWRRDCPGLR